MIADFETANKTVKEAYWEISHHYQPRDAQSLLLGIIGMFRISEENDSHLFQWYGKPSEHYQIGERLNKMLGHVEETNPEYRGWFEGLDYTQSGLVDQQQNENLWLSVIAKISQISLSNLLENDSNVLCRLCISLNDHVSQNNRRGGFFDFPGGIVDLISGIFPEGEGQSFYDPFCNSGISLINNFLKDSSGASNHQMDLYAETRMPKSAQLIRLHLFCAGIHDVHISVGDVIQKPGFVEGRHLKTFDHIGCLIPMSVQGWGEASAKLDQYGRFVYGIPPNSQGDLAYLEHCIASLSDDGVLVAGVAPSVLFRGRTEGAIRRRIVEADLIEAVISLPPKLLPQTGIPLNLLVIRRNKPDERKGKVLFVDASGDFLPGRSQNVLRTEDIEAIQKTYESFDEKEGLSKVCSVETIAKHDFILEVRNYVTKPTDELNQLAEFDLKGAIAELETIQEEHCKGYERMNNTLKELMKYTEME